MGDRLVIYFTGAGISSPPPSNIPTYRGPGGLYRNKLINMYVTIDCRYDNECAYKAMRRYLIRASYIGLSPPNDYHKLAADIARESDIVVITQNVDDLFEKATSFSGGILSESRIIHVHGKIRVCRENNEPMRVHGPGYIEIKSENIAYILRNIAGLDDVDRIYYDDVDRYEGARKILLDLVLHPEKIDYDELRLKHHCMPAVVLFGEPVNLWYPSIDKYNDIFLIIAGTSGVVYPAALIPEYIVYKAVSNDKNVTIVEVSSSPKYEHLALSDEVKYYHVDYNKTNPILKIRELLGL